MLVPVTLVCVATSSAMVSAAFATAMRARMTCVTLMPPTSITSSSGSTIASSRAAEPRRSCVRESVPISVVLVLEADRGDQQLAEFRAEQAAHQRDQIARLVAHLHQHI